MLASSGSLFSVPFSFFLIISFCTFVVLSSFSRGKHTRQISRAGKAHTHISFILLRVSVHMHCFLRASDSECRSSEAVFLTAHMFVKVLSVLASDREFFQAILSLAFALAFR